MSKVKMRCARCSKSFKSSDARQTLCPDCLAKERLARARGATPQAGKAPPPRLATPAPIIVQAPPPDTGAFGSVARRADEEQRQHGHGVASHPAQTGVGNAHSAAASQERHAAAERKPAGASTGSATKAPAMPKQRTPKPPKEQTPPTPHELTDDERERVEQLYLQLAQPREFDGIRTRIAAELGLPKSLVRKAVLTLRETKGLPSWWELQAFPGTAADLERVRVAYTPLLPVPPVGVHKQIAEQLGLESHAVYTGIRQIRAQMGLPQFNPPEQHPEHVAAGAMRASSTAQSSGAAPATGE